MSSAEATLQIRTSVGNASPTMLQTLLNLLNLYEADDTDRRNWISCTESHPGIFMPFVIAIAPKSLEYWHEQSSIDDLYYGVALLESVPKDVVNPAYANIQLLIDCSGSMMGHSMNEARKGVLKAIDHLTEGDKINSIEVVEG